MAGTDRRQQIIKAAAQLAVEGGAPVDICVAPPIARQIDPEPLLIERLAPRRAAFRDAYPRITPKKEL